MKIFETIKPTGPEVPVILSIPHSGTEIPKDLQEMYDPKLIEAPEDTDWFLDDLYDFASEMGIMTIKANYSRWVIDLNRDPESKPLYDDGRVITELTPKNTFSGKNIYTNGGPNEQEVLHRLDTFYWPYYEKIQKTILELQEKFNHVLIWDAHSIKHKVPSIQNVAFPNLILGDNEKRSANTQLISKAIEILGSSNYSFNHNHPFKGGHITRYFGNPSKGVHALQLEMSKLIYMDDTEIEYHEVRASQIKSLLKTTMHHLSNLTQIL